ncbi:MAG: sigma 54-interacting transcriptional regulator [Myxococcales bacterium]|nr:sigma 54-interacting transcriptional regulator [Myxococcales bacterium]
MRVVAATSRDLDDLTRAERFRFDLYHRIAQLAVRVPPLRERPADVDWLAEDLLKAHAPGRQLTDGARAALAAHGWPGNVRELKNTIERAIALSGATGPLEAGDLMLRAGTSASKAPPRNAARLSFSGAVRALARRALHEAAMPKSDDHSAKLARAEQRAAFLYLRLEEPLAAWPQGLIRQFQRLFGPLWTTTEGGRGLAELMVTLGLNPVDTRDRAEMSECLDRAGVSGGGG